LAAPVKVDAAGLVEAAEVVPTADLVAVTGTTAGTVVLAYPEALEVATVTTGVTDASLETVQGQLVMVRVWDSVAVYVTPLNVT